MAGPHVCMNIGKQCMPCCMTHVGIRHESYSPVEGSREDDGHEQTGLAQGSPNCEAPHAVNAAVQHAQIRQTTNSTHPIASCSILQNIVCCLESSPSVTLKVSRMFCTLMLHMPELLGCIPPSQALSFVRHGANANISTDPHKNLSEMPCDGAIQLHHVIALGCSHLK